MFDCDVSILTSSANHTELTRAEPSMKMSREWRPFLLLYLLCLGKRICAFLALACCPTATSPPPPHAVYQRCVFPPSLLAPALSTTAQDCALRFYFTGSQSNRVVFTGLTAEEKAATGNNTSGHRLTCACTSVEGLTPLQWLDVNGMVLREDRKVSLVDYKVAGNQPGSAVRLRINKAGFSCAEAGNYTCVVGNNTRSVLVTPIGKCSPISACRSDSSLTVY